jgi:hypothetical protein
MGASLWLVRTGKGERTLTAAAKDPTKALPPESRIADNLASVVAHLLSVN